MLNDGDRDSQIFTRVHVDLMRTAIRQRVGRQVAESLRIKEWRDMITQDLVLDLEAGLLAETLPPERLQDRIDFTVPRFATWRDHFRATYRGRWWARLLRLREPQFIDEPLTHVTSVQVLSRWTYPQATTVLPGRDFGHVVLKADASIRGEVNFW